MPTRRRRTKPRAYCKGSGKVAAGLSFGDGTHACSLCYRAVRVKSDGTTYMHFAKAPVTTSDPIHNKRLQETYGITGQEYEAIFAAQNGACYICEKPPVSKRLAVDHNHDTGEVRGLLCRRCNHRLLGSAHDATRILSRAIDYLTDPPARAVLTGKDWTKYARTKG